MRLTQDIREYAFDLGFDRIGFTTAEPFDHLKSALRERREGYSWISEGLLQLSGVSDPRFVLPSACSLVVLLYDYHKQSFPPSLLGKVGKAYQARLYPGKRRIFGSRLRLFKEFLEQQGMEVGTRPAMPERQAAARAGLGSFGRNTFIYTPQHGSYIGIITMAVNRDLGGEVHEMRSSCPAECRRCIEACPTGALYEPFKMNPLRCIAFHTYATGNLPGAPADIPHDIREKMGCWIYGCDICQDVCPRNEKKLKQKLPPDAYLAEMAGQITAEKLLNMDERFYLEKVQPLLYGYIWEKKYFQRNAAIALGNRGEQSALIHLVRAMEDSAEMVRSHAAWALGRIGGDKSRAALESYRSKEPSAEVLREIDMALQQSS